MDCVICKEPILPHPNGQIYGNNPAPVRKSGECCDECHNEIVMPKRLTDAGIGDADKNLIRSVLKASNDLHNIREFPSKGESMDEVAERYYEQRLKRWEKKPEKGVEGEGGEDNGTKTI